MQTRVILYFLNVLPLLNIPQRFHGLIAVRDPVKVTVFSASASLFLKTRSTIITLHG